MDTVLLQRRRLVGTTQVSHLVKERCQAIKEETRTRESKEDDEGDEGGYIMRFYEASMVKRKSPIFLE